MSEPGVIVIRHFPKGFNEDAMQKYFSQFGLVLAARVVRSRKTGNPRTSAFVKFAVEEVAKVAADAMDNYLMFGKIMRCEFVPHDKITPKMFPKRKKFTLTTIQKHKTAANKRKKPKAEERLVKNKMAMIKKAVGTLSNYGISFEPVVVNIPETNLHSEKVVKVKSDERVLRKSSRALLKKKITAEPISSKEKKQKRQDSHKASVTSGRRIVKKAIKE